MGKVEYDTARHQKWLDDEATKELALESRQENARETLLSGEDYSEMCSHQTIEEGFGDSDEFWRLLRQLWIAQCDQDLATAADELRAHCRADMERTIDLFVGRG